MHELAMANQIVEIVEQAAREYGTQQVLSANITVGKLMGVEVDNLLFALDAIKSQFNTTIETSFHVDEESIQVKCGDCHRITKLEGWVFACSWCGSRKVQVVAGESMTVWEIEIAD